MHAYILMRINTALKLHIINEYEKTKNIIDVDDGFSTLRQVWMGLFKPKEDEMSEMISHCSPQSS